MLQGILKIIIVDKNKCPQDHQCPAITVCPKKAITQTGFALPMIDHAVCVNCRKCVNFCPKGAMRYVDEKKQ